MGGGEGDSDGGGGELAKVQVSIRATANFDQQISRGGRKF